MNPPRRQQRRPIEHLALDLHLARFRLEWARVRTTRGEPDARVADLAVHLAGVDEAKRYFDAENGRLLHAGEQTLTRTEDRRARFAATCRGRAERRQAHCGCWRCVDARTAVGLPSPPPAREAITFKVRLGSSNLEVKVGRDRQFISALDLDRDELLTPFQLLDLAAQLGRLPQLQAVALLKLEAVAC